MSNIDLIIEERSRDIGDFLVGRILPFRKKRMVGPFIFIDHMGPSLIGGKRYMDVDQHPHIGLSTLTYMLEGEIMHEDSIGTKQRISPGSVNWMTAGKGISHTERTPQDWRDGRTFQVHGYQIWVALPREHEFIEPSFHHIPADELPMWQADGATYKLVAGKGFGKESPVPVYSDLFMVEVIAEDEHRLEINGELQGEIGVCVVHGSVEACGETVEKGNMMVSKAENICDVTLAAGTHVFLFGGTPFPEERFIHWNFVASSKETLEQAKQAWINKEFPKVPGDDSYVPLPGA
ncbi:pirin family protein [Sanyastnella coralliicola]|uniref:pirin family protein n=1 Tax=Sanyastnella coralliicola TaxID=3069118 RepID=UPI0027B8F081|nr:pirin family protein [Longitalea sp. SCSIO 12813]